MLRSMGRPCESRVGSRRVRASGMTRPSKNSSSELSSFSESLGKRLAPLPFGGLRGLVVVFTGSLGEAVAGKVDRTFLHWEVENLYIAMMPSEEKDMTGRITSPKNLNNKGDQRS